MRGTIRAALLISAFSPTLLILGLSEIAKAGLSLDPICSIVAFILLSILGWLIVFAAESQGESMPIRLKKIEPNDSLLIPFVVSSVPGILRFMNLDFAAVQGLLLVLFLIGLVVSYIPIHPVLRMIGYRFFKSETEDGLVITIITKRDVRQKDSIKSVIRISENLFVERNSG